MFLRGEVAWFQADIKEAEQTRNAKVKEYENEITQEEARKNTALKLAAILKQTNQRR